MSALHFKSYAAMNTACGIDLDLCASTAYAAQTGCNHCRSTAEWISAREAEYAADQTIANANSIRLPLEIFTGGCPPEPVMPMVDVIAALKVEHRFSKKTGTWRIMIRCANNKYGSLPQRIILHIDEICRHLGRLEDILDSEKRADKRRVEGGNERTEEASPEEGEGREACAITISGP